MYPKDAEFLNREIHNYAWMKLLWAFFNEHQWSSDVVRPCKGVGSSQGRASSKSGANSKSARSGKSVATSKGAATSKK